MTDEHDNHPMKETDSPEEQVGEQAEEQVVETPATEVETPTPEAEAQAQHEELPVETPVYTSALSGAIAALQSASAHNRDRLLRTAADFENYKKRSKREATAGAKRAEDRVVLDFLPVIDNLERALTHSGSSAEALLDGVKMVHKQFLTMLEKYEIKPFDSVGEPFSPELHEAVQQMPSEEPAATVCQEIQRGYLRGDRLVRPAMVIVSTGPAAADEKPDDDSAAKEPEQEEPKSEEAEVESEVPEASTGEK